MGEEFTKYPRGSIKYGIVAKFFSFLVLSKTFSTNIYYFFNQKKTQLDVPGGPMVRNLPANAGDTGLIPGPLSPCITATEACVP